jgi:DNA-directed DNA polymerase III PolC
LSRITRIFFCKMYLNCHSYFSTKYGVMSIAEVLEESMVKQTGKIILTDINTTSGCLELLRLADKKKIEASVGIDFRNGISQKYIGLPNNNQGFEELNRHLSFHLKNKIEFDAGAPDFQNSQIIYPFSALGKIKLRDNEYIGVKVSDLQNMQFINNKVLKSKMVMLGSSTFKDDTDFKTHRLLRAIGQNTLISKLPLTERADANDRMLQKDDFINPFLNFPQLIKNTEKILDHCKVSFNFGVNNNKSLFTKSKSDDQLLLEKLAWEGFYYRYGNAHPVAKERLEKELKIINDLNFTTYFLITEDIVRYAQHKGYFHIGRGSGANSIAAYCLQITDVDPIELDLYFERFINSHRTSPPDFDLDFSWKDRDDVTDYIFIKYGTEHVALLATYSTFQFNAAIRELGKVFGLPKEEIDNLPYNIKKKKFDTYTNTILKYAARIENYPNHLSIHAGGVLISEKPIYCYTATELPPKGFPITQFDMITAEDVGLYKFDILSQRGLGHIKEAVDIIHQNRGVHIDIHDIRTFKEDTTIKALIRTGRTMGCFYVESPAMRMLLSKLKCETYLILVAASSIIRPGVARSGMMREYIQRFHHPEAVVYLHPKMKDLLQETFGVMVYQEDVIKIAHHFAGLSLAESDVLRRGMSGKFRSREEFKKIEAQFFDNCKERGYSDELSKEVWRQIESFAGYSFSKAHSASYAVESFQSLYLKAHYPLEFITAVINNFGGFYSTEFYVHEARMCGAVIQAPCVNNSSQFAIIKGIEIYLGFVLVKDLEKNAMHQIISERQKNGAYKNFSDFAKRINVSLEQLFILIRVGALRFTNMSKQELLWEAHLVVTPHKKPVSVVGNELFDTPHKTFKLPQFTYHPFAKAFDELELIGFSLCNPFDLLKEPIKEMIHTKNLRNYLGGVINIVGYLVTVKNTTTITNKRMQFATFIDRLGYFYDTTHFPNAVEKYPFTGKGIYAVTGKVIEDFGALSIEVSAMERLKIVDDPRYA